MKTRTVNIPSVAPKNGQMHKADEIAFQSNGVLTLGVEIELQLIDPDTQNLAPRAKDLLAAARHVEQLKPEYYLSTVEINTGICQNVQEAEGDLRNVIAAIQPVADRLGIHFAATGTHPFTKYSDCLISPTERYKEMTERNQWMTRRMTVYGLHVHLGMSSGDDCIRFNNFFMHFLPHLLALSSSSPFWQGMDTGLAACRPTMYQSLPTAGLPYETRNWRDFTELYTALKQCDSIKSLSDLWWDLRPSPHYGTLEIRVCDGTATLYETMAIVAFIHCLAHWFHEHGDWLEVVTCAPHWIIRENKWRAIRSGLDAELVINSEGQVSSLRDDMAKWMKKLRPFAEKLGYQHYMNDLSAIMAKGTSSMRQRMVFEQTGSLEEVVKFNVAEYMQQRPNWNTYLNHETQKAIV